MLLRALPLMTREFHNPTVAKNLEKLTPKSRLAESLRHE